MAGQCHIHYRCSNESCGYFPLDSLYVCSNCVALKCSSCVIEEIDSYYCPYCLQTRMLAEASLQNMRCSKCFDCPVCQQTLVSTQRLAEDNKGEFLFFCGCCGWDSISSGGVSERPETLVSVCGRDTPKVGEFLAVLDRTKARAEAERDYQLRLQQLTLERDRSKKKRGLHSALASNAHVQIAATLAPPPPTTSSNPSQAVPPNYNLALITTLEQRFSLPLVQPLDAKSLVPIRKPLLSKLSKKCSTCRRILVRPNQSPMSTFKIASLAWNMIPEITIVTKPETWSMEETEIQLRFRNHTAHHFSINLTPHHALYPTKTNLLDEKFIIPAFDIFGDYAETPEHETPSALLISTEENTSTLKVMVIRLLDHPFVQFDFNMSFAIREESGDALHPITLAVQVNLGSAHA